jgi:hypothetical protein
MKIGSISTVNELTSAMEEASKAIGLVSDKLDSEHVKELMKNLIKEDARLDMKQEMIGEAFDEIGENMTDEVEEDRLYKQILMEAGMKVEEEVKWVFK